MDRVYANFTFGYTATQKKDQEVTQVHSKKIFCTTYDKRKDFFSSLPLGFGRTFCVHSIHAHRI